MRKYMTLVIISIAALLVMTGCGTSKIQVGLWRGRRTRHRGRR